MKLRVRVRTRRRHRFGRLFSSCHLGRGVRSIVISTLNDMVRVGDRVRVKVRFMIKG